MEKIYLIKTKLANLFVNNSDIKEFLDEKVAQFNQPNFIENDPISVPHQFTKLQDIEIIGFWTAVLAWGRRATIINKSQQLATLMDNAPYDFICNHQESDLKAFLQFKHRTFNATDALYFIAFFKDFYSKNNSLESGFSDFLSKKDAHVGNALIGFHDLFFGLPDFPHRTRKHIATPARKSACKRINMFLRWMVRNDTAGVDFGLWKNIKTSQLLCPLDVHVARIGRKLGLMQRTQNDWKSVEELDASLRRFDSIDPVKFDFALFGLGAIEGF